MKTVHKFTLDEAKEILRKHAKINDTDEIEIDSKPNSPYYYPKHDVVLTPTFNVNGTAATIPSTCCTYY